MPGPPSESDFHFISRLLAEEGIFYYFDHQKNQSRIIFGDSPSSYEPIIGKFSILYKDKSGLSRADTSEYINQISKIRRITQEKITYKDYNFERPNAAMESLRSEDGDEYLEHYEYPGGFEEESRGNRFATLAMERTNFQSSIYKGQSNCPDLCPGKTFKLSSYPSKEMNREYVVISVEHYGEQPQVLEALASKSDAPVYQNKFKCIPSDMVYRPNPVRKPSINSVQTAKVMGAGKEEIYTDQYGRVKVQFHWDRYGVNNDHSSCWVRVAQTWAGPGWGSLHLPRAGNEVIVEFIDGDPDRPIITGSVYNGENLPPYPLPEEKTKSYIQSISIPGTGVANELRFEDKAGEEELFTFACNNRLEIVGNNKETRVTKSQIVTIDEDRKVEVKACETNSTGADYTRDVKNNYTLKVDGNLSIDVKGTVSINGQTISLNTGGGSQVIPGKDGEAQGPQPNLLYGNTGPKAV